MAWQFLIYQDALEELNPEFDECPSYCVKFPKRRDFEFCKTCDVGIAKQHFEEATIKLLNDRLGNKWKIYGFDNLLTQVKDAFRLKEEKKISVTAQIMVDILNSEEYRQRRIERWNRKQEDLRNRNR